MSETTTSENISVAETESQLYAAGTFTNETTNISQETFPRLDGEVFPLVAANADVIAPCRWMGGAEVTLTTAMINYPARMTEEIADQILADVQEFLSNQVLKTQELQDEQPVEEELAALPNEDKAEEEFAEVENEEQAQKEPSQKEDANQVESNVPQADKQSKGHNSEPEHPQPREAKVEVKESGKPSSDSAVVSEQAQISSEQSADQAVKTEADASLSNASTDVGGGGKPEAVEVTIAEKNSESKNPTQELAVDEAILETEGARGEQNVESQSTESASEPGSDSGPAAHPGEDVEEGIVSIDEAIDYVNKEIENIEEDNMRPDTDYQIIDSPIDLTEEEALLEHFEEIELEDDEQSGFVAELEVIESDCNPEEDSTYQPDDEPTILEQQEVQITPAEQFIQIRPSLEEAEEALIELAEVIDSGEPEIIEVVNEKLDKIIEVPTRFEAESSEDIITETEAQEELEELFTELLDSAGIDYTPELVESLAYLTLKSCTADKNERLDREEGIDEILQDPGTHEAITQLLLGISNTKKSEDCAHTIGKSALLLCRFSFAPRGEIFKPAAKVAA